VTNLRRAGLSSALSACDTARSSTRKLIPLPAVLALVPIGRAYWYELVREGKAPRPVKLGKRSLWLESEISAWVERLAEQRAA
jgi:prophage regulatory protein